jgi:hypothetical protein
MAWFLAMKGEISSLGRGGGGGEVRAEQARAPTAASQALPLCFPIHLCNEYIYVYLCAVCRIGYLEEG